MIVALCVTGAIAACQPVAPADAATPAATPVGEPAPEAAVEVVPENKAQPELGIPDDYAPYVPAKEAAAPQPIVVAKFHSEIGPAPAFNLIHFLTVQSTADEIIINSTELNRGNCPAYPITDRGELPATLMFGDQIRVQLKGCSSLLEATVHTNLGAVDFTFEPG